MDRPDRGHLPQGKDRVHGGGYSGKGAFFRKKCAGLRVSDSGDAAGRADPSGFPFVCRDRGRVRRMDERPV